MESLHHRWQLFLLAVLFCLYQVESKSTNLERIINGENAKPKQFPYQVFYDVEVNKQWRPKCGGTIIGKKTILTAAHCLDKDIERIKIYLGAVDINNSNEIGQQIVIVAADSLVIHEEWNRYEIINDIALIKLPNDLEFNNYIQPAKLPEPDNLYVDKNAVVSGWGLVKDNSYPNNLQYTNVKTLSNKDCEPLLSDITNKFHSHWLCVEPNERRPCSGDSGGPLAERNDDKSTTVLGIVSFGGPECSDKYPTVFTRVSYFLNWIAQHRNES